MKNTRDNQLSDRRAASADAKSALLNAYRAAQLTAAPAKAARQAERALVAAARDERRQARERIKMEEEARIATEAAERQALTDAAALAETEARESAEKARVARVLEDEATRKAARDLRYANRKARQA